MNRLTEREQWEMAASLVDEFGSERVGDHVMKQIKTYMEAGNHSEAKVWIDLCEKLDQLGEPDENEIFH